MIENILTADNTNIVGIQLNLFDYYDEKPDFNEVLNNKITGHTDLDLENGVILTSPNHFEFDTRRCPKCGEFKLNKRKFVPRKAILDKIGDVKLFLREYYCKACHRYPKVKLKNILSKFTKVSISFKEKLIKKARNGTKSLRNSSKDFEIDGVTLSHQSIGNHLKVETENEITFNVEELSGYYGYDEQYLHMGKDSYAKAQLIDLISNQTIAIKIFRNVTSKNVETFLNDNTPKDKRIGMVTDHDNTYPAVLEKLGFKYQQLCLFHFAQIIKRTIRDAIKDNNFTREEIKELKAYGGRIQSIFLANSVKDFIYRLNRFFKRWDSVPKVLKNFYNKKVVRDMNKLTQHLFNPYIPKTNNLVESKFSGAQQKSEKRRFKTIKGCLSYLKPVTERQNEELKREKIQCEKHVTKLEKSIKKLFER